MQQKHPDAEQPLLTRVFCTKDKAQVAFELIFHQRQGLCQVLGGACPAGALLPPHTHCGRVGTCTPLVKPGRLK